MAQLYWQTLGAGKRDLVLLHGWGLNAEVWQTIALRLMPHFKLHLVDLPGYGRSQGFPPLPLAEMAAIVARKAPPQALWLGWSLGGLLASLVALDAPERVTALITVASSPYFAAGENWAGIKPEVLVSFQQQLSEDFQRTVERFLALQTLGTTSARQDVRKLKEIVLNQPLPTVAVLNQGLEILRSTDLRQPLTALTPPFLRIYGKLDGLVPRSIVTQLDVLWPTSISAVIAQAAHAPFISHPEEFVSLLLAHAKEW